MEKKKGLKAAKEALRAGATSTKDGNKDGRKQEEKQPKGKEEAREPRRNEAHPKKREEQWETTGAALKGVPQKEVDEHKKDRDNCW